jgi:hypothetical protein
LGLVKQFVTAMDFGGEAFQEIRLMYPKMTEAKLKAGIFIGPQVRAMLASESLENKIITVEKTAWKAFREVVNGFLGNHRVSSCKDLVYNMIAAYETMGCRMSLKLPSFPFGFLSGKSWCC